MVVAKVASAQLYIHLLRNRKKGRGQLHNPLAVFGLQHGTTNVFGDARSLPCRRKRALMTRGVRWKLSSEHFCYNTSALTLCSRTTTLTCLCSYTAASCASGQHP